MTSVVTFESRFHPCPASLDLRMAADADSSVGTSTIETIDLSATQSKLLDTRRPSMIELPQEDAITQENMTHSRFDIFSPSRIVDMKEPYCYRDRIVSTNNSPEMHDILFSADGNFSSAELAQSTVSKPSMDSSIPRSNSMGHQTMGQLCFRRRSSR